MTDTVASRLISSHTCCICLQVSAVMARVPGSGCHIHAVCVQCAFLSTTMITSITLRSSPGSLDSPFIRFTRPEAKCALFPHATGSINGSHALEQSDVIYTSPDDGLIMAAREAGVEVTNQVSATGRLSCWQCGLSVPVSELANHLAMCSMTCTTCSFCRKSLNIIPSTSVRLYARLGRTVRNHIRKGCPCIPLSHSVKDSGSFSEWVLDQRLGLIESSCATRLRRELHDRFSPVGTVSGRPFEIYCRLGLVYPPKPATTMLFAQHGETLAFQSSASGDKPEGSLEDVSVDVFVRKILSWGTMAEDAIRSSFGDIKRLLGPGPTPRLCMSFGFQHCPGVQFRFVIDHTSDVAAKIKLCMGIL